MGCSQSTEKAPAKKGGAPAAKPASIPKATAAKQVDHQEKAVEKEVTEEKAVEKEEVKEANGLKEVDTAATCMAGGMGGVSDEVFAAAKAELTALIEAGARVPDRGDLDKEGIAWRHGKPDYTLANLTYLKGKRMNHAAGSLEEIVENVVKTWEMEASHKTNIEQWETVSLEGGYKIAANGSDFIDGRKGAEIGNYNALLMTVPKERYDAEKETFDSSHVLFRDAFPNGFPWELTELYAGPPKITFGWRHWATFNGTFRGNQGKGQLVEMLGVCQATVDANLKITALEIFYKPCEFLDLLEAKDAAANSAISRCPFLAAPANAASKASEC